MAKLKRRGDIWHAWIFGRLISTRCSDKTAARAAARELERAAVGAGNQATVTTPFGVAARAFFDEFESRVLSGQRSSSTLDFYSDKLSHLVRVIGAETPLDTVGAATVDAYVSTRIREGSVPATIGKELTALRQVLRLARRRGLCTVDVAAIMPIGFAWESKALDGWCSPEHFPRLLAELPPERRRAAAFILATAADWSSVEAAQVEDLQADGTVLVRGTKNPRRWRRVPVYELFREHFALVVEGAPKTGKLFERWQNVRRDMALACERAGIPRVTPRDLRRSHAKWLRAAGVEPHVIASSMGHADGRMVERRYGRLSPEALKELVDGRTQPSKYRATGANPSESLDTICVENPRVGGSIPSLDTESPENSGHSERSEFSTECTESSDHGGSPSKYRACLEAPAQLWALTLAAESLGLRGRVYQARVVRRPRKAVANG